MNGQPPRGEGDRGGAAQRSARQRHEFRADQFLSHVQRPPKEAVALQTKRAGCRTVAVSYCHDFRFPGRRACPHGGRFHIVSSPVRSDEQAANIAQMLRILSRILSIRKGRFRPGLFAFRRLPGSEQDRRKSFIFKDVSLAGELGFEPRQTESESVVLPLHHSPIIAQRHQ